MTKNDQHQIFIRTDELITPKQLCAILNVAPSWVYRRTANGASDPIPHVHVGGGLRFRLPEVLRWVERQNEGVPNNG